MPDFIQFIVNLGNYSLSAFWFPFVLWSLLSILAWMLFHFTGKNDLLLHYHTRVALLVALLSGIVTTVIIDPLLSSSTDFANDSLFTLISIPNPITSASASHTDMILSTWDNPLFLLGVFTLLVSGISLCKTFRLWNIYRHLHQLVQNTKTYFLEEIDIPDSLSKAVETDNIKVAFSSSVKTPLTFGWQNPVIILPVSIKHDFEAVGIILQHEIVHIQRHDFLLNMLVQIIKTIFWINPLVHLYAKEAEIYRESSCDLEVLSTNLVPRKRYAELLYEIAPISKPSFNPAINIAANSSILKNRLSFMKKSNTSNSLKKSCIISLISFVTISGFLSCTKVQNPLSESNLSDNVNTRNISLYISSDENHITVNGQSSTLAGFTNFLKEIPTSEIDLFTLRVHEDAPFGKVTDIEKVIRDKGILRVNYRVANEE